MWIIKVRINRVETGVRVYECRGKFTLRNAKSYLLGVKVHITSLNSHFALKESGTKCGG
jgi:hypothetical protein